MRRWIAVLGTIAAAACIPACGTEDPAPDVVVEISNVQFSPMDVTTSRGGTVEWRFDDGGLLHHVESPGLFDSGITGDGTYRHTFTDPGVYEYTCSVHPYMTGIITVL
ncbi:biphenyl 2,3-dioxygenase [Rhodococcus sp. SRB_17]|uniref:cupredoxin domain-containing protein n=1 Tax=Rhodococcus sp. OK302 TaxID=1882769 RepID=UPI000B942C15|nr:cupredoxin domain-containing protein [Rhodococcus sp. OK302]NMM90114.1 biphenyl 2,3-dioxygenase [Rhodococcus sp. SRB_17]OYD67071.1 plastocyanin [Rhodococcus sp. OK302]